MMSRAAYMMQDHIRRSYSYITDIYRPNTFICRGRLSFPQGLTAISVWFNRKTPADLYAHPYFIEKQSNPDQPSPQMHTTEEVQGILKVMQGLRYMRDDFSKLDNTMCVVTDYLVPAKARMLIFDPAGEGETGNPPRVAHDSFDAASPSSSSDGVSSQDAFPHSMERLHEAPYKPSRVPFPRANEAVANPNATQAYFNAVLRAYQESLTNASPSARLGLQLEGETKESFAHAVVRYAEREGGYTVLYNPCELNERTLAELIVRLEREGRVVKAIVVPTRQTWRDLQVWADAFPDAEILSSGPIPLAPTEDGEAPHATTTTEMETQKETETETQGTHEENAEDRGGPRAAPPPLHGYRDFGEGVMGLSFPEVDLDADATPSASPEGGGGAPEPPFAASLEAGDPADPLWTRAAAARFAAEGKGGIPRFGLRARDAARVRGLSGDCRLTPRVELLRVAGDPHAREFVLYDHHSRHLACVELFHGSYGDFDPLNTWLCRVWFKFMRRGNHKRTDLVPRFKWRQVTHPSTLRELRGWVDELTRRRPIHGLIFAHGTPPLMEGAANGLRAQWGLPPLTRDELRRAEAGGGEGDASFEAEVSKASRNSAHDRS